MERAVILGSGGHAKVIFDLLESLNRYEVVAVFDPQRIGTTFMGAPVVGGDDDVKDFAAEQNVSAAFVAIGGNSLRLKIGRKLNTLGISTPNLISPYSYVSRHAIIGAGTVVMPGAIVHPCATVGEFCVINTNCSVDHDCAVQSGAQIGPGATLCGNVFVGERAFVCAGATVIPEVHIGADAIIGAGAAVIRNVDSCAKVVGVPAFLK